jgi:hypothetical protein
VRGQLGRHPVEQRILLPDEGVDRAAQRVALAAQGIGMTPGFTGFHVGERRLGDERAQARLLGGLFEERQLLVGHRELGPQLLEPLARIDEAAAENRLTHGRDSTGSRTARAPFGHSEPQMPGRVP